MTTIWVVIYTDDRFADEIGSRVFSTEAEADAWADEYVGDHLTSSPPLRTGIPRTASLSR